MLFTFTKHIIKGGICMENNIQRSKIYKGEYQLFHEGKVVYSILTFPFIQMLCDLVYINVHYRSHLEILKASSQYPMKFHKLTMKKSSTLHITLISHRIDQWQINYN